MPTKRIFFKPAIAVLGVGLAILIAPLPATAQSEKVLHNFGNGTDGTGPNSLIADSAGNLFGTTLNGGIYEGQALYAGTAFELSRLPGGGWKEQILHNFGAYSDGNAPGGLISDGAGNLYGTTFYGGAHYCAYAPVHPSGCGTVFELKPPAAKGGPWTEVVLYSFTGGDDGYVPNGQLTLDSSGNLYGTTQAGGLNFSSAGAAFELSPTSSGNWSLKVLHSFNWDGSDGAIPSSGLTFGSSRKLYGTTCQGGAYSKGVVFELAPITGGNWGEKILYSFNSDGADGTCPGWGLTFDSAGNLYGTTTGGGESNGGTMFELTRSQGGVWNEQVLYSFKGGSDGSYPSTGVLFDGSGDMYGATTYGGIFSRGAVYKLTPAGGSWAESVLYSFGNGTDGQYPDGNVLMDRSGNLYGTTQAGGIYNGPFGSGTVFEIKP